MSNNDLRAWKLDDLAGDFRRQKDFRIIRDLFSRIIRCLLLVWLLIWGPTIVTADSHTSHSYREQANDLEFIQNFLENVPANSYVPTSESACSHEFSFRITQNISVRETNITIENMEISEDLCPTRTGNLVETERSCIANLVDLKPAVELWSGPTVILRCKGESVDDLPADGASCFACKRTSLHSNSLGGNGKISKEINVPYSEVHVGSKNYYFEDGRLLKDRDTLLHQFVRALTRIIDAGDDSEFCLANSQHC